jgi:GxxExxY protein
MILNSKKLQPEQHEKLKEQVYEVIGSAMDVCRNLPCGLPEYIYQEAFSRSAEARGLYVEKEFIYHPTYMGKPLKAFIKPDFLIKNKGVSIILEAKAIDNIGANERRQLFGYLIGTGISIGILVNFAMYPKPQIERYYYDADDMTLTAF